MITIQFELTVLYILLAVALVFFLVVLPNILHTGDWMVKNKNRKVLRVFYFIAVCLPSLFVILLLISLENIIGALLKGLNVIIDFLTKGVFGAEKP